MDTVQKPPSQAELLMLKAQAEVLMEMSTIEVDDIMAGLEAYANYAKEE